MPTVPHVVQLFLRSYRALLYPTALATGVWVYVPVKHEDEFNPCPPPTSLDLGLWIPNAVLVATVKIEPDSLFRSAQRLHPRVVPFRHRNAKKSVDSPGVEIALLDRVANATQGPRVAIRESVADNSCWYTR
ncbi:hypothetical protein EXIGLDRAFT_252862 [Exidia glandulosa HHB12029]|uniref:Uncharacterized protein n=1 Tax=Exidia glandulosa HHB12029 TaxID=1314781 RepID=A0A165MIN5_EXIGL|nr:hypothetical protein EXIGLDRAFT_252862 [Exidia glandulosa HHB12029]